MKKILLRMLLPVLALVLVTSCEKDVYKRQSQSVSWIRTVTFVRQTAAW